jgi:two-component system, NtrC family, sensor kinase
MKAPFPFNEEARIAKLLSYKILDTLTEIAYDDLTSIAAHLCQTPIALISLIDRDRQWFKSKVGLCACETHRDVAFCAHAILQPESLLIVPDATQDERFATNPLVTSEPHIRFYAGIPLVTPDGYAIGTLCVIDYQPRNLSDQQVEALRSLSRQVVSQLELRLNAETLAQEVAERQKAEAQILHLNAELEERVKQRTVALEIALNHLKQTQTQLVHTEKISSLGQLVAGVAHEVNNPVGFVAGNLLHASRYVQDLLDLIALYQQEYPTPGAVIQEKASEVDLEFLSEDLPKLLASMKVGTDRIREIVDSLRNFSRVNEAERQPTDLHAGLESTLMILRHRLKANRDRREIHITREYGNLPPVTCYPGQLNQVFMNLLANAIDALEESVENRSQLNGAQKHEQAAPAILIRTEMLDAHYVQITIADNGTGISEASQQQLFAPFFTTKPIGKGTGLGLSISHQIVTQNHQGSLKCTSALGQGTQFIIQVPVEPEYTQTQLLQESCQQASY